ncbi:MAG: TIGR01777 family protein [Myxococcales bacterium]|nr:TIGR01777 family protein [Myxococcales bacterium]
MRIVVTGGTGFIGQHLVQLLLERGDEVVVLTRSASRSRGQVPARVELVEWTPKAPGPWQTTLDGADAVIHLAGKPVIDDAWSDSVRREIMDSRVITTRLLVEGIQAAAKPPAVMLSGSAVGYYGDARRPVTEESPPGDGFLAEVCEAWEVAARPLKDSATRLVTLRIGIVLGTESGALPQMTRAFKFFAGGYPGSGEQHLPWIHWEDACGMMLWALENAEVTGPLNLTAPSPPTIKAFTQTLGEVMGRPSWIPVPGALMRAVAGERAAAVLEGQNAPPKKALELGYAFIHPELKGALRDLLG